MEPNILLIGKNLETLKILKDELVKFKRTIFYANSKATIDSCLKNDRINLIIIGAGLPIEIKENMLSFIDSNFPNIEKHIMERTPGITPASMIGYTNEKAVMWRLLNVNNTD